MARGRQAGWSVCYPGAPRWPMLARRTENEDEARSLSFEERRGEENRGASKKHGGLAPREDLPKTEPESLARLLLSTSLPTSLIKLSRVLLR